MPGNAAGVIPSGDSESPVPTTGFRHPVTLRGRYVELVPLERTHVPALARAGRDPEVWRYLRIGPGRDEPEMSRLVEEMLELEAAGSVLPFAVVTRPEARVVGMFRFLDIDRANRWVEVGTWLDPTSWRTPVNSEVKYLGLRHAFDEEAMHRVQLRTDLRNVRSQTAIERLGAFREGVHREHLLLGDGVFRTSVVYSLLRSEWPTARRALESRLARPWRGPKSDGASTAVGIEGASSP